MEIIETRYVDTLTEIYERIQSFQNETNGLLVSISRCLCHDRIVIMQPPVFEFISVCFRQEQFKVDPEGGLTNLRYKVESRKEVTISGAPCTVISTYLECDLSQTPWCQSS